MTGAQHVFIVGLPRTGTTLTRAILNTSTQVAIGGESKFLPNPAERGRASRQGFRDRFRQAGDIQTDEGIARIATMIYGQTERNYWSRLAEGLDRREFEARLRASDRTDQALFGIAMDHFANGRPIRGDKTPQHIHWVPLLLEWYPDARVIHTFRDPRAIHESLLRKGARTHAGDLRSHWNRVPLLRLYLAMSLILRWRRVIALHERYQTQFPGRYMLLQFEELIADPRSSVERLCAHVGIDFSEAMLDQIMLNSSYVSRGASKGFDPEVVERWSRQMSPLTRRWFAVLCGDEMRTFGYGP